MGKILKKCDVCGQFHASYRVQDEKLGSLRLCYSCWKARFKREADARLDENREEPLPGAPAAAEDTDA